MYSWIGKKIQKNEKSWLFLSFTFYDKIKTKTWIDLYLLFNNAIYDDFRGFDIIFYFIRCITQNFILFKNLINYIKLLNST
jgi:hypothetical protein